jgi:hypothetical protein
MATYPISGGDDASLLDVVNYVASGPSGVGQQLEGFSDYNSLQLTGNYRIPYTASTAKLYVAPIALSTAEWLDDYTWKYTFASTQPDVPFALGNGVTISGVTPSDYDDTFSRIGVVECTTNYVILRSSGPYFNPGPGTGGFASLNVTSGGGATMSTDANAIVSIDAGNTLVSITGQLDLSAYDYAVTYTDYPTTAPELNVYVQLNRYIAQNSGTAANPQYFYNLDKTISQQLIYNTTVTAYTQGIPLTYTFVSGTSNAASGGIYTSVDSTSTSGNGTGARITLQVTVPGTAYSTGSTILSIDGGGNYQVGDTVTWKGTHFGGTSPANDLVLQVASIGGTGDITVPKSLTIFTPVIDNPTSGLYWYLLEVLVEPDEDHAEVAVKSMTLNRRSLTAQVIKK